jgi:hypothetical protein
MLLSTWMSFKNYDGARGKMPVHSFAVMSAKHRGLRVINEQRNAALRDSKAPSRFPVPFSDLGVESIDVEASGEQFETAMFLQAMDSVLKSVKSVEEKEAIRSWVTSGFDDDVIGSSTKARAVLRRAKKAVLEAGK